MRRAILATVIIAPFLGGMCEGVSTDPREGGFMGGVCGMQGPYQERTRNLEHELDRINSANNRLQRRLERGQQREANLDQKITDMKASLAADLQEIERLRKAVTAKQRTQADRKSYYDSLLREIDSLRPEYERLKSHVQRREIAARAIEEGMEVAQRKRSGEEAADGDAEALTNLERKLGQIKQREL